jgi:hypothetical protein
MGFLPGPSAMSSIIDQQKSRNKNDVCTDRHDAVKIAE